jgi:hypothetical protein
LNDSEDFDRKSHPVSDEYDKSTLKAADCSLHTFEKNSTSSIAEMMPVVVDE